MVREGVHRKEFTAETLRAQSFAEKTEAFT